MYPSHRLFRSSPTGVPLLDATVVKILNQSGQSHNHFGAAALASEHRGTRKNLRASRDDVGGENSPTSRCIFTSIHLCRAGRGGQSLEKWRYRTGKIAA
jgi:hypothetical protein